MRDSVFPSQEGTEWGITGDAVQKMDALLVRGDSRLQGAQRASVTRSVERSITAHQGAANTARFKQTTSYRTILKDFVFSPAIKIPIF